MEEPDGVEKFSKGYEDYLQAPLQPLMDNLESQVGRWMPVERVTHLMSFISYYLIYSLIPFKHSRG
jgi:hypothetical protein